MIIENTELRQGMVFLRRACYDQKKEMDGWIVGLRGAACASGPRCAGYRHWKEEQTLKNVQSMYELYNLKYPSFRFSCMADFAQYDYQGLWRVAHTIALVTPEDELIQENSRGISETGDRFYNAHSVPHGAGAAVL